MEKEKIKPVMKKEKRQELDGSVLNFKWAVSRARDTYGYNICTLKFNGHRVSRHYGGGYDLYGTCLGEWIQEQFLEELKKLKSSEFYGLRFVNPHRKDLKRWSKTCTVYVSGACGFSSMERILFCIGFRLRLISNKSNLQIYMLEMIK